MSGIKVPRLLSAAFYALCALAAFWLFFKYALPLILPFILAFATAWLIEPVIRSITKKTGVKRCFVSALCTAAVIALAAGGVSMLCVWAVYELSSLTGELPELLSKIVYSTSNAGKALQSLISSVPAEIREYITSACEKIKGAVLELPAELTGKLLSSLSKAVSSAPRVFLFAVTYAIGVFFVSSSFPEIKAFFLRQLPQKFQETARALKGDLGSTIGKWILAQLKLMLITFSELTAALLILKADYAVLLALLISLIDALPILGVGTVLIPWALIQLIYGDMFMAVGLITTYVVIAIVRSILEPKLVGKQIGLHPAAALFAIYVGFRSAGIWGMIGFPIILVMAKQMNDRGYIKLWK